MLELCEFAVDKPSVQLDAVTPEHETRETYDSRPFIADTRTGIARWVSVSEEDKYKRIILSPDEGGPLYTAWQFCAKNQLPIGFCRDELQLARSLSIQSQMSSCSFEQVRHKIHAHFGRVMSSSKAVRRFLDENRWGM